MRNYLFIVPLLFLISFQLPWTEFKDYEGKFVVLVPGEMSKKENPVETPLGEMVYHSYFYQPTEKDPDNILYMISYCDYPEGGMHSDSIELLPTFFDETLAAALESVKGDLLYSDDIVLQGFKGKLWRLVYREGEASIKSKALMVGNRFYMVQTIGFRDKGINPNIDKFLDSFRLIE